MRVEGGGERESQSYSIDSFPPVSTFSSFSFLAHLCSVYSRGGNGMSLFTAS